MFKFTWTVPDDGFAWLRAKIAPGFGAKGEGEEGEFLAERFFYEDHIPQYKPYSPLAEAALFRTFADLPNTRAGVLNFANRYGFLGGDAKVAIAKPTATIPGSARLYVAPGERFEVWQREIEAMRYAVDLWEAARRGDTESLSKFVRWREPEDERKVEPMNNLNDDVRIRLPDRGGTKELRPLFFAPTTEDYEFASRFIKGDLVLPARYAVHQLVNEKITQHGARPTLLWDQTQGAIRETLRVVPQSLISALWIQLANALEGDRQYRQCDECRKWFEVSGDRRADARFCSNPCRFKAYRKRQNDARRLSAAGVLPKEIAKQLGSDVKTVRGWIS